MAYGKVPRHKTRNDSWPGMEVACEIVERVGEEGGGRRKMAHQLGVSMRTIYGWLDEDDQCYKGEEFREAVERGLTAGAAKMLERVSEYAVAGPADPKINMGAIKFIAQHQYGMVEKTEVENTQPMRVTIEKEDADL